VSQLKQCIPSAPMLLKERIIISLPLPQLCRGHGQIPNGCLKDDSRLELGAMDVVLKPNLISTSTARIHSPRSTTYSNLLPTNEIFVLGETEGQLAPSSRITAFLARSGLLTARDMALTVTEPLQALADQRNSRAKDSEALSAPPDVVTTPCDPWPRPYYLEDDLRKVYPYHYTYNTYCKERWRGRELLDIFATEFRDRPQAYYVRVRLHCLQNI